MTTATKPTMFNWRRIVGQRVRRMSADQAKAALATIRAEGITIHHATIREITNGLCSQSINSYVTWKLAERAGMVGPRAALAAAKGKA